MNILIFNSKFSDSNKSGWVSFFEYFEKNNNIFVLTEKELSKKNILKMKNKLNIQSINVEISNLSLNSDMIKNQMKKYDDTLLIQERLSIINSEQSLFYKNNIHFEELLAKYISFIENYLNKNKIDLVFMCIVESYQSYIYSVLEKICNKNSIPIKIFQHPILRNFIYDNQLRYSQKIYEDFLNLNNKSLSKNNEIKVKNAINSYQKYMQSKEHFNYLYKKKNKLTHKFRLIFKKIFKYNKQHNKNNFLYNSSILRNSEFDYSILLLNKTNNYRNYKFSPYYSLPINLIRNISLSLPHNHVLLVKVHPHDNTNDNEILNEVNLHYNTQIIAKNVQLSEILPQVKIVFSMSTTASIEALMYFKHLVMFGENIQFFGNKFNFVSKITNFENLKKIIRELLNRKVDKNEINKFFYCFFNNSYSFGNNDDANWNKYKLVFNSKELFTKAAIKIDEEIKIK